MWEIKKSPNIFKINTELLNCMILLELSLHKFVLLSNIYIIMTLLTGISRLTIFSALKLKINLLKLNSPILRQFVMIKMIFLSFHRELLDLEAHNINFKLKKDSLAKHVTYGLLESVCTRIFMKIFHFTPKHNYKLI